MPHTFTLRAIIHGVKKHGADDGDEDEGGAQPEGEAKCEVLRDAVEKLPVDPRRHIEIYNGPHAAHGESEPKRHRKL